MGKKIGVIGSGGVGASTLVQAVLEMESEILSTYRLIELSYPLHGRKVPTLVEFRRELKERVETSTSSYKEMCDRYRMGCLYIITKGKG